MADRKDITGQKSLPTYMKSWHLLKPARPSPYSDHTLRKDLKFLMERCRFYFNELDLFTASCDAVLSREHYFKIHFVLLFKHK